MMPVIVERLEEHTLVNTALLEEATECTALVAERANEMRDRIQASELALAQLQELVKVAHGRTVRHNEKRPICARCFATSRLREIALELEALKS
jgi:hypothetical protein